jgi:[acyl-carrier-protein] S-malonyltransferase
MGKGLYDAFSTARNVFHEVDDAISFFLSRVIFDGPEDTLRATENAQPALMAISMAFTRVLEKEYGINIASKAKFLAGHSLGEYTALCVGGVLTLPDTAKILRIRGAAMSSACPTGRGAMAAILGLSLANIERIIAEYDAEKKGKATAEANITVKTMPVVPIESVLQIANDNCDGQVVISGNSEAVTWAIRKAIEAKARRAVLLDVSGPFHCQLMNRAVSDVAAALEQANFSPPVCPIISNVTARAEIDGFRQFLLKQIVQRVRWRESILFAEANSITHCVEIGAGRVLTGLVRRICPQMELTNVCDVNALDEFAKKIT